MTIGYIVSTNTRASSRYWTLDGHPLRGGTAWHLNTNLKDRHVCPCHNGDFEHDVVSLKVS